MFGGSGALASQEIHVAKLPQSPPALRSMEGLSGPAI
ncbi:hypothetical protein Vi05172_g9338 [Venturia inaequalis]|nr:hypothetical protein Vi05172_g9338 [Venturia inaequalis]